MQREIALTPAKEQDPKPYRFIVDTDAGTCRILDAEGGVFLEADAKDAPLWLEMPGVGSAHRGPAFYREGEWVEFRVDKDGHELLASLAVAGAPSVATPDLAAALETASRDHPDAPVLVAGSLYLAGEALALLDEESAGAFEPSAQ